MESLAGLVPGLSSAVERARASVAAQVFSAADCCSLVLVLAGGAGFVVETVVAVEFDEETVAAVAAVAGAVAKAWRAGMMILAAVEVVA